MSASPEPLVARDPVALLRRLEWTVVRRLDGLLQGDYRTLFRGFGIDLADLREYQFADDVRRIDWNATARLQTPYVREFTEDREVTAWFLLDLSPSVDFGSGARTKRAVSIEFTGALARVLMRHGNRVGALFCGEDVDEVLPARAGRRHLLQLLGRMLARPQQAQSAPTDLGRFAARAATLVRRRSLVFVVSDFVSTPGWEFALARLAMRNEVIAVRLVDPLERSLPDLGLVPMRDAESGETVFVDTHDRAFRRRFETLAAEREAALVSAFAAAGIDALELDTTDDVADAVVRFAALRRRFAQRGGGVAGLSGAGQPTGQMAGQSGGRASESPGQPAGSWSGSRATPGMALDPTRTTGGFA